MGNTPSVTNEETHGSKTTIVRTKTNLFLIGYPIGLFVGISVVFSLFFSCTDIVPTQEVRLIDSLNNKAYKYRYRILDSSYFYAREAYSKVKLYKSGKAEAANNLGFWLYMKMDFDRAEALHKEVYDLTKNELELLIADIGLMKICQRTALNKEFYDYRNSALRRMKRIREESDLFADRHERLRLHYAFTEFYIVSAIYYYFLQQKQEAMEALKQVPRQVEGAINEHPVTEVWSDTSQLLYYHYIKGAAGLVEGNKPIDRKLKEFDQLFYTWKTARQKRLPYFEGNGLQGLATLLTPPKDFQLFCARRMHVLEEWQLPVDSLLPLRLAQQALQKFRSYGDLYQIAGAYVSIGKCLNRYGRYAEALDTLTKALDCVNYHHSLYYHPNEASTDDLYPYAEADTSYTGIPWITEGRVKTVPEWIARIREQLSVSYAGLGKKAASDYNRNSYLDILNFTRQDKELESRYDSLEAGSRQMTLVLSLVLIGLVLVVILWWFLNKRSKLKNRLDVERLQQILGLCRDITSSIPMNVPLIQKGLNDLFGKGKMVLEVSEEGKASLVSKQRLNRVEKALVQVLEPYILWASDNELMVEALSDEQLQLEKQRYIYEQHIASNKRQNLIKKACLAIVNGIHPYIDRILNEVHKLIEKGYIYDAQIKKEKYLYMDELVTTINEYNDILALWIKMKQGTLSLNIETFDLNELFELVGKGRRAFEMKRQTLQIEPTQVKVKADRALTLFMINTLAENARKYTPEGGSVKIYARSKESYVEISIEDNGRGLSPEDVNQMMDEKVYDSSQIGMKHAENPEELKKNKGSGFGLMNCKGIIEKYKKTNALFQVCTFQVDSELGKGSRFYFRLPLGGVRNSLREGVSQSVGKILTGWLLVGIFYGCGFSACQNECVPQTQEATTSAEQVITLSDNDEYEDLLDAASEYANAAYFANIDSDYEQALQYVDSAMMLLNEHYEKYAQPTNSQQMKLIGEGTPAEISWWNELFDTDYHVILDIRNEAAVAFLALKQIEGYDYNNAAFTNLYKLQGEDQTLEAFCRQLERSNTNKRVGLILCFVLLFVSLIGYYFLYMRKRLQNRLNLEQVLEINQKIFAASLIRPQEQEETEALQREEDTLKDIPQRIVNEAFGSIDELFGIYQMGLAVYNESSKQLEYASQTLPFKRNGKGVLSQKEIPSMVSTCFTNEELITDNNYLAVPLKVEVGEEHRCVGVLYLEKREASEQLTDRLMFELVARYMAIVVFNAVVKLATQYRSIESAHEEARRASWEDSLLHVQNMVLDNCLSTIKHETLYYPNKIKQIVSRLRMEEERTVPSKQPTVQELEAVETITELIEYYKGIFTILSSCASRQLEEVTFRRSVFSVHDLFEATQKYFKKVTKNRKMPIELTANAIDARIVGDINQLRFLLENLIDEAVTVPVDPEQAAAMEASKPMLHLAACQDKGYIRISFTDFRREKSQEELNQLFYPNLARMTAGEKGELRGTEYLVCKQIIRDHDEFAGRRGCRINAEPAPEGGFTVYFTVPCR